MLVLSRLPGESILVGDDVCIRVIEISGGRVLVGIDAPLQTPIMRLELVAGAHESNTETPTSERTRDGKANAESARR